MRAARIRRKGTGRWTACLAAAAAIIFAFDTWTDGNERQAVAEARLPPVPYPPDYQTMLDDVDRGLATARERTGLNENSWLAQELLARAWFERGRLTGSYSDYEAAQRALGRSFALAPTGTGPHLLQALFDLSMHRLSAAEAQLDVIARYGVPPDDNDQAEIEAMRGDIALYRGRYQDALDRYDAADRLRPGAADFRRVIYHAATGRSDLALDHLNRSERDGGRQSAHGAAWFELQRGIIALDLNDVERARAHFAKADVLYPGYWLIEEHLAETMARSGETVEAERQYQDLVRRTGSPEFMDALADIARRRGDAPGVRHWTRRASRAWQERLRAFPEASYGHAFDHCLAAGDTGCALTLAQRNLAARPYGESSAMLVEALAGAGREEEARAALRPLLATPWRSARTRAIADRLGS